MSFPLHALSLTAEQPFRERARPRVRPAPDAGRQETRAASGRGWRSWRRPYRVPRRRPLRLV